MALTYNIRLKIFHDRFIECVWGYIERQKALEAGEQVPKMITPFQNSIFALQIVPVVDYSLNVISFFTDIWSGRFALFANVKSIETLFPYEKKVMKQIFSKAIQEVAINFEQKLCESNTEAKIGSYANAATMKFLNSLKSYGLKSKAPINEKTISEAILKQHRYFSDVFAGKAQENSVNYKFIYSVDIREYLEYINQDSEHTETDCIRHSFNLPLSTYFRTIKYQLSQDVQIILRDEVPPDLEDFDLSYENLNGYEFDTDDESIRLLRLEAKLERIIQPEVHSWAEAQIVEQQSQLINEEYFYNSRILTNDFVGRTKQIATLHNNFEQTKIQIVRGNTGVGKTQFVLKYIKDYGNEYDLRIRWFSAPDVDSLIISFREYAKELNLDTNGVKDEDILKIINHKLESYSTLNLLIFDDVIDTSVYQILSGLKGILKHHVIMITNNIEYTPTITKRNYIFDLDPLTVNEAIEYIHKAIPRITKEESIKLALLFDKIPLALSLGTSYIRHNQYVVKQYIEDFQEITATFNVPNTQKYLTTLYQALLLIIKELSNWPKSIEILQICGYLHKDAIPDYIFDSLFASKSENGDMIAILSAYSLISIKVNADGSKLIYLHRLMQDVIKLAYGNSEILKNGIILINKKMSSLTDGFDIHEIFQKNQPLEQHALSLIKHAEVSQLENIELKLAVLELKIHCGNLFFAQGKLDRALSCYDDVDSQLDNLNIETGDSYNTRQLFLTEIHHNRGNVFEKLSRYQEALIEYNKALELKIILFTENSIQAARTTYAIGCVYCRQGEQPIALDKFSDALLKLITAHTLINNLIHSVATEDDISIFLQSANNQPQVYLLCAKIFDAMGTIHTVLKQHKKALSHYDLAARVTREMGLENDHDFVILNRNHLGETYLALGKYILAKEIYEENLALYQAKYNYKPHINIAMAINRMGDYYLHTLQYQKALENYKESLVMKEIYGEQYIDYIAATYGSMGQTYFRLSMLNEALQNYEKSLTIKKGLLKDDHPEVLYLGKTIKLMEFSELFIIPFILKELLESKSTFKYFLFEIIHIEKTLPILKQIGLPEWVDNKYFLFSSHFVISCCGVYLINLNYLTSGKWVVALPTSLIYGVKLITYDYFIQDGPFNIESHKPITSYTEFFGECSDDIVHHALYGWINLLFSNALPVLSTPMKYDVAVMAALGGASCYNSHRPIGEELEPEHKYWMIPYIADFVVGIRTLTQIGIQPVLKELPNNQITMSIILVKQILIGMNTIVLTDYTSKILLSIYENEIDEFIKVSKEIFNTIENQIVSFWSEVHLTGEEHSYQDNT